MQFKRSFLAYHEKVIKGEYDSLVSVVPVKDYLWNSSGPLNYEANKNHTISQDLPDWFRVTNGNYMAPSKLMQEKCYLLGDEVYLDVVSHECGIDIDTLYDLQLAKAYELVLRKQL